MEAQRYLDWDFNLLKVAPKDFIKRRPLPLPLLRILASRREYNILLEVTLVQRWKPLQAELEVPLLRQGFDIGFVESHPHRSLLFLDLVEVLPGCSLLVPRPAECLRGFGAAKLPAFEDSLALL